MMDRKRKPVKSRRTYDSSRRKERARQTHLEIVETARQRFLQAGFTPTTVRAIARDAGVSVDTIYKTFGGKSGLVRAIYQQGLAGEGPVHAEARSDRLQTTELDSRKVYEGLGRFSSEVAPRAAPIHRLIREAAATDPEMRDLLTTLDAERLARMRHVARNLTTAGHVRDGLTVEQVGDILWTYTSPQLYELLVTSRGWTAARFGVFVGEALTAALAPERRSRGGQVGS